MGEKSCSPIARKLFSYIKQSIKNDIRDSDPTPRANVATSSLKARATLNNFIYLFSLVENKLLPCHRAVLSAIDCEQLHEVLSLQDTPVSIKLEDFPFDGVTAVLDFIYTGHAHIR